MYGCQRQQGKDGMPLKATPVYPLKVDLGDPSSD